MQDSIGYSIKKLHLATRQIIDQSLAPYNLSQAQGEIIYYLLKQDGQMQTQLGQTLKVSAPTITKMIDGLIEKGFVVRHGDESDARRKQIYLTEQGRKFQAEIAVAQRKVESIVREGFTSQELAAIRQYIKRMQSNVDKATKERL